MMMMMMIDVAYYILHSNFDDVIYGELARPSPVIESAKFGIDPLMICMLLIYS